MRTKSKGLRRAEPFILRFNKQEMIDFMRFARESGLNRTQYARCRILRIPFEMVGGKRAAQPIDKEPQAV